MIYGLPVAVVLRKTSGVDADELVVAAVPVNTVVVADVGLLLVLVTAINVFSTTLKL